MAHLVTSDPAVFNSRSYDYLVIGGGTAGLAVASRLAEDQDITVGVLEAGHDHRHHPQIDIPGHFGSLVGNGEFDWKFETTPQDGLGGRKLPWPRGRVLGGTSALNFVVWNRGARQDYDTWEELGNSGWGWESLLPFFNKSESLSLPSCQHQKTYHSAADPAFHGNAGPISTSFSPWYAATHPLWRDSLQKVGIPSNASALSGSNIGSWTVIQSVDSATATRSYSASAYLLDDNNKSSSSSSSSSSSTHTQTPNLVVLTGATARRISLARDHENQLRATGVEYTHEARGGSVFTVLAKLEVLLAAGTIQSPQLLEVSGIGDSDVLGSAGVPVQLENKNVGRSLQDHLMTTLVYEVNSGPAGIPTPEDLADPDVRLAAEKLYAEHRDGIYRSSPSSMSYVPLKHLVSSDVLASLRDKILASGEIPGLSPAHKAILVRQLVDDNVGHVEFIMHHGNSAPFSGEEKAKGKRYASLHVIQQYPFARGQIHIRSANIAVRPTIDPAYYSAAAADGSGSGIHSTVPSAASPIAPDLEIMTAGIEFAAKIPRQSPLNGIIGRRVFPPEGDDIDNDKEGAPRSHDDWRRFVRETTVTDWHPVGTCAMLPLADGGVVDARLRVHGVSGLRVVDASIIPLHISSHLQATVYAIAEKGAAMVREDRLGR